MWKHPLDCKTKDAGRQQRQKWFTGAKWATFCAGHSGSPGGPRAIASLVLIMAEDMQEKEVVPDVPDVVVPVVKKVVKKRGGRAAFAQRAVSTTVTVEATLTPAGTATTTTGVGAPPMLQRNLSAAERNADEADLAAIHVAYGARAQTIINTLLAFDTYFEWYYPLKASIPFMCPMPQREARALENMQLAINMHESAERLSIKGHKSFLFHGAISTPSAGIS